MASLTKNAIKESFLHLLEERPFSKITVKDIVDGCGVNRNSFYYHFADVPSLLDEILEDQINKVILTYPTIGSAEECITVILQFIRKNQRSVLHVYHSVGRDTFERHLWKLCDRTVRTFFRTAFPDVHISDSDREVLIRCYKCECFGSVTDWLAGGMRMDLENYSHRLFELRAGMTEEMIRRCEQSV